MPKVKHPKFHHPIEKHFNVITRYHYYFFSLIFVSKLPIFWHVLNLIFLSPPVNYSCKSLLKSPINNLTLMINFCPCDAPSWDQVVFTETTQTKFNLICDRAWLVSFSESITFVGTLIGSFLFGFLSDKYVDFI